jgi:hypothetical protein
MASQDLPQALSFVFEHPHASHILHYL